MCYELSRHGRIGRTLVRLVGIATILNDFFSKSYDFIWPILFIGGDSGVRALYKHWKTALSRQSSVCTLRMNSQSVASLTLQALHNSLLARQTLFQNQQHFQTLLVRYHHAAVAHEEEQQQELEAHQQSRCRRGRPKRPRRPRTVWVHHWLSERERQSKGHYYSLMEAFRDDCPEQFRRFTRISMQRLQSLVKNQEVLLLKPRRPVLPRRPPRSLPLPLLIASQSQVKSLVVLLLQPRRPVVVPRRPP